MTPDVLISHLMGRVKTMFYADLPERSWFNQMVRVKAALTLPAVWLQDRQVELSSERYQSIVEGILNTIRAKGRRKVGAFPCAYLHACIESHLKHHIDEYYEEGKAIRNRLRIAMPDLEKARIGADGTVPIFAQVHATLDAGKRKAKVKPINKESDLLL